MKEGYLSCSEGLDFSFSAQAHSLPRYKQSSFIQGCTSLLPYRCARRDNSLLIGTHAPPSLQGHTPLSTSRAHTPPSLQGHNPHSYVNLQVESGVSPCKEIGLYAFTKKQGCVDMFLLAATCAVEPRLVLTFLHP